MALYRRGKGGRAGTTGDACPVPRTRARAHELGGKRRGRHSGVSHGAELTGQRRPREHGEDDDGDKQSQTEHCALVDVRRRASVRDSDGFY